jgi:hypothetical protein
MSFRLWPASRPARVFAFAFGLPALSAAVLAAAAANAHGIAGNRFFPATLATDDPAVADELSLPTVSYLKTGDDPAATETDVAGEWSKRLTSKLGVSFAGAWTRLSTSGAGDASGFQNLETTIKYQALTSAEHEAIVSVGVSGEWGGVGSDRVGAEATGTVTPTLYFGKGAGDLPESLAWARPLAVTGVVGYAIPTRGHELVADPECDACAPIRQTTTRSLTYGLSLQYSLRYLSAHVKDYGLPTFVNQLTPLVEFAATTPVENGHGERTTGTVNPGVIWSGRHMQLGLEAQVPINRDSGKTVGVLFQVHWFLDDLFPHSIGKPIW